MADIRLLKVASGGGYAQADDTDILKIGSVEAAVGMVVGFDGTPAADQIQIGDANFVLDFGGGTVPLVTWDTGSDDYGYVRSTNTHRLRVGAASALEVAAAQTRFPDGAVGAPGLGFLTDTDTGWFLNGAGVIAGAVGGVEVSRLQSDGLRLAGALRTLGAGNTPETTIDNGGSLKIGGELSPAAFAAQQNDYNPAGLADATILRLDHTGAQTMTGIAGGFAGRILFIVNIGATNLTLSHESASSTAANRFDFTNGAAITLGADDRLILVYDSGISRWRDYAARQ